MPVVEEFSLISNDGRGRTRRTSGCAGSSMDLSGSATGRSTPGLGSSPLCGTGHDLPRGPGDLCGMVSGVMPRAQNLVRVVLDVAAVQTASTNNLACVQVQTRESILSAPAETADGSSPGMRNGNVVVHVHCELIDSAGSGRSSMGARKLNRGRGGSGIELRGEI